MSLLFVCRKGLPKSKLLLETIKMCYLVFFNSFLFLTSSEKPKVFVNNQRCLQLKIHHYFKISRQVYVKY